MHAQRLDAVKGLTGGIEFLFKKNKIEWLKGHASFESADTVKVGDRTVRAKNIVIATGSSVTPLPGVEIDEKDRRLLDRRAGAGEGARATSSSSAAASSGSSSAASGGGSARKVTCVEFLDQILPGFDDDVRKEANKIFKKQGIEFRLGTKVTGVKVNGGKATLTVEPAKGGAAETIEADTVLVSIGRRPNTEGLALDKAACRSTSAARSRPTMTSAPRSPASGRSATSSPARCSPTRPRTKASRSPRTSRA